MTQLLIRLFIRDPDDTRDPAVRTAYGNLASLVGMACNLLLCIGKLVAGTLFGSIAIMADALNNLSDASSNIVSLIGSMRCPTVRLKRLIQSLTAMEAASTPMLSQLKMTGVGWRTFTTDSLPSERPMARMVTLTTSPARYSYRAWP